MNYIDFIIIGILVVYMLVGYFKGFMFSFLSLFSTTVKFLVSILLCKPVLLFVNGVCKLDTAIANGFQNKFSQLNPLFDVDMSNMTQSQIAETIEGSLGSTSYPNFIKSFIKSVFDIKEGNSSFAFGSALSQTFGRFYSFLITFTVLFVLICVLIHILKIKSKLLTQNSVTIRSINHVGGIAFGFAVGVINIAIVFIVLSWFKNFSFLSEFYNALYSSFLGGLLSDLIFPFVTKYFNIKEIFKWFFNLL